MDLTLRDAADVRAGPAKKSVQSMQFFSGARDGRTSSAVDQHRAK
jgi:hypothetical protein